MRVKEAAQKGVRLLAARVRGRAIPFHVTLYVTKRCIFGASTARPQTSTPPN